MNSEVAGIEMWSKEAQLTLVSLSAVGIEFALLWLI